MSTFQLPFSSSPPQPSTPNTTSKRNGSSHSSFADLAPHPSTTPLGPPPSFAGSSTPAGPPPSSLLGSSQIDDDSYSLRSSNGFFAPIADLKSKSPGKFVGTSFSPDRSDRTNAGGLFGSPLNNRSLQASKGELQSFDQSYSNDEPEPGDFDHNEHLAFPSMFEQSLSSPYQEWDTPDQISQPRQLPFDRSTARLPFSTSRGSKRSRAGNIIPVSPQRASQGWPAAGPSTIANIAQGMISSMEPAVLEEPHKFIAQLERCGLNDLCSNGNGETSHQGPPARLHEVSQSICAVLNKWAVESPTASEGLQSFEIGPGEEASSLRKAAWLSTLLVESHPPDPTSIIESLSQRGRGSYHISALQNLVSVPKILLDWLDRSHNPWTFVVAEVELQEPSPPAHYNFWDIILSLVLRGKLESVVEILKISDFQDAESATKDNQPNGYGEAQLDGIEVKVERLISQLQSCPGIRGDWHTGSNEWILFRKAARKSLIELESIAEESHRSDHLIPWTVNQSLKIVYGVLLGNESEILASAQDWVEATIGLAIWREASESDVRSLGHSGLHSRVSPTRTDRDRFQERLCWSFGRATDGNKGDSFQINTDRSIEIGLACVFEGNLDLALGLLHGWSLAVTDAVVELAAAGGWYLPDAPISNGVLQNFDNDDLMVLSTYGQSDHNTLCRDPIIIEYASALFRRGQEGDDSGDSDDVPEWELAMGIMKRIQNREAYGKQIDEILSQIKIDSDSTMDSVLEICHQCNMAYRGHILAERYADIVLDETANFGRALKYYARSHAERKVRNVLDLLVSMSLIRSNAFPAQESIDENLRSFLDRQSTVWEELLALDREGTTMLRARMPGYATIRRFYDLRDSPRMARDRAEEYRRTLLAVIASTSNNVEGGTLDEQCNALVRFEGLLVLLGEALALFKDSPASFDDSELYTLLKAMENLQALPKSQFQQCEEFLQSTLGHYNGQTRTLSPSKLLQTMSSMTSGSSFSLVSSSLLESMSEESVENHATEDNHDPEKQRGWDWRSGLKKDENWQNPGSRMGPNVDDRALRISCIDLADDVSAPEMQRRMNDIFEPQ